MNVDTKTLTKDEQVYLELQRLFEKAGYRKFKMRKFEEYSLYLENKSFLASDSIIAFNDPNGKLLALKPDVTLSIVKNAKATEKSGEKVYYKENVYRLDKQSREYKEINQVGLEYIGNVDLVQTIEICTLAINSLKVIDDDYIFAMSHMGYISDMLDGLNIESTAAKTKLLACIRSKNAHELGGIASEYGIDDKAISVIKTLVCSSTDYESALKVARNLSLNDKTDNAVDELESIFDTFKEMGCADKVRLDFSVLNDIDYYNGIIFQGFVAGFPRIILSGGRYDKLLDRFKSDLGAMGFALALQDLNAYYPQQSLYGVDVVLLYDNQSAQSVLEQAQKIRLSGKSVIICKELPAYIKFSEVVEAKK